MKNPADKSQKVNEIAELFRQLRDIDERVSVVEEQSGINRNMIDDLNVWKDIIEDRLDKEL